MGSNTRDTLLEPDVWKEWKVGIQEETDREIKRYSQGDWEETLKGLLADCPAKIEAALLALFLEMRTDPTNKNLNSATKYLTWALRDIVRAQMIAWRRL